VSVYQAEIMDDGKVDVTRDRRAWKYDLDDLDEALAFIRREQGRGWPVTVVEQDGYRRIVRS
jgi:hypothetical protein